MPPKKKIRLVIKHSLCLIKIAHLLGIMKSKVNLSHSLTNIPQQKKSKLNFEVIHIFTTITLEGGLYSFDFNDSA